MKEGVTRRCPISSSAPLRPSCSPCSPALPSPVPTARLFLRPQLGGLLAARRVSLRAREGLGTPHPRPVVPQAEETDAGPRPRWQTGTETDRARDRDAVPHPPATGVGNDSDRRRVAGPASPPRAGRQ